MTPEALRQFKKRHGLANACIARALGLPVYTGANGSLIAPTVSQWLNGKAKPPPYLWRALAHWIEHRNETPPSES